RFWPRRQTDARASEVIWRNSRNSVLQISVDDQGATANRRRTGGLNRRPRPAHPPAAGAPPPRTICVCTPKPPSFSAGGIFVLSLLVGTCTLVQYLKLNT